MKNICGKNKINCRKLYGLRSIYMSIFNFYFKIAQLYMSRKRTFIARQYICKFFLTAYATMWHLSIGFQHLRRNSKKNVNSYGQYGI